MSGLPKVLAIDYDGTIVLESGKLIDGIKEQLEALRAIGWKIIVWTVRDDNEGVAKHLTELGVPFDHINENPYNPQRESRKIYADVYLDNRAISFTGDTNGLARKVAEFKSWDQ